MTLLCPWMCTCMYPHTRSSVSLQITRHCICHNDAQSWWWDTIFGMTIFVSNEPYISHKRHIYCCLQSPIFRSKEYKKYVFLSKESQEYSYPHLHLCGVCVCVSVWEREREREIDTRTCTFSVRARAKDRDRERERVGEKERGRECERTGGGEREGGTEKEGDKEREGQRERERERLLFLFLFLSGEIHAR